MTRLQKVLDFVFGVALIGGAPVAAFVILTWVTLPLLGSFLIGRRDWMAFVALVILALAVAAFALACVWRRKHRRLPSSTYLAEMLVGIFIGALFVFIFVARAVADYFAG